MQHNVVPVVIETDVNGKALLSDALFRIGRELSEGAKSALHLEHTISNLSARVPMSSVEDMRDLQAMDLLRQTLEELAVFVTTLSETVEATDRVDVMEALSKVRLSDLRSRLDFRSDFAADGEGNGEGLEIL